MNQDLSILHLVLNASVVVQLVMLLLVGVWTADREQHPLIAGALLAAAIAIKLFPGFLLLYFLLQRKWLALAATCVGLIVITGLTAVVATCSNAAGYASMLIARHAGLRSVGLLAVVLGIYATFADFSVL